MSFSIFINERAGRTVQARDGLRLQHLLSLHHGDGPRPQAPRHRHAFLQPRSQHEAGGGFLSASRWAASYRRGCFDML